ncbi:MAG: type II toxin-antitoxin system RelE/ParE family toxin [Acidobacteriota bacterium]
MSSISIRWERRAVKELQSLSQREQQRVYDAVTALRDNPLKGKALSGRWKGLRRLRVGARRVIYAFDGTALFVSVVRVGHRREVFR